MVREIHMYRNKRQDITHVFIFTKIANKISLFWEAEVSLTLRDIRGRWCVPESADFHSLVCVLVRFRS